MNKNKWSKNMLLFLALTAGTIMAKASTQPEVTESITGSGKINTTTVQLTLSNGKLMLVDFYGNNIFRLFRDDSGKGMRTPEAKPEAEILVANPRKPVDNLTVETKNNQTIITTDAAKLIFDNGNATFSIINNKTGKEVVHSLLPIGYDDAKTTITLGTSDNEYFYGGGVQNGRFSHKGRMISIENQNSWTDGGVASPTPFYWSTNGYAVMWHTFKKGRYDFGSKENNKVILSHEDNYLDVFFMVSDGAVELLNDFYQLTGNPVLLPKFGFYQGHLNAYNRDFWKEDENGILFEDGKKYKESQKDNGGIKESLNGELNNYQFSARAVVDRYLDNDMPLGWVLPNDGYGAGYGQTETLDGNIANLKTFGDYARSRGVEIGLWTQSDLHPKEGISALLQRDIVKEVRDAGVRVLKTDVAWVGAGYSFGLNGVADVGEIMPKYGNNARPFIISLDGWAGTQRYAGIWSGDQTGGLWEYIRFHIPTYIGSGLSGQPNITSDMDGIFGGQKPIINIRDFQWKTFTPMELNMDGWGSNPKYPQALGEPATSINRNYLKLKSELLPYQYSIARESVDGMPIIRAMFLHEANEYTLGRMTQYQYMFGPWFVVAPIYQDTQSDSEGNDIRNTIYLPEGLWVDYFTGAQYQGGQIINNIESPIWKLPVFVKRGAIIPMTNPNNNTSEIDNSNRIYAVYPYGKTSFTEYDDDGLTEEYRDGKFATTLIQSNVDDKGTATVTVNPAKGSFEGMVGTKSTTFKINVTKKPKKVEATINGKKVKLTEVMSVSDLEKADNAYFYNASPDLNRFSTQGSDFEKVKMVKNPEVIVKIQKHDITSNTIAVSVKGFEYQPSENLLKSEGTVEAPKNIRVDDKNITAYTAMPTWDRVENADIYEIDFNNQIYGTIRRNEMLFDELTPETNYDFKIRAVNKTGKSGWTTFSMKTKADPLKFAIKGISGTCTAAHQPGNHIRNLFDREEGNMWHTKWDTKVTDYDIIINLNSINQLDKLEYLPRTEGRNGNLLKGKVSYSNNKKDWTEAGSFSWSGDNTTKSFAFEGNPTALFVKISVSEGVGGFGSGRELYLFKVPGTESVLPGDINNDKIIDRNDLTSYLNYTGLRTGDGDFDGYVSNGDVNKNGRIDAYDISVVATQLEDGVDWKKIEPVAGSIEMTADKANYSKGETVTITVKGKNLKSVNAMGFALPYSEQDYEYAGIEAIGCKEMENLTNDRLHTNGEKVLYPTFVNIGDKKYIEGNDILFIIKMKAKRNLKFNLKPQQGMLVDKDLNTSEF
jgi:alpha-glucosidase (family GH31 glycosyl hydrolase)